MPKKSPRRSRQALDAVMLEMGRMVAESIMLIEREELAGPDYYPTHPGLQKWAHEAGSTYIGDQKVKVDAPPTQSRGTGRGPAQVLCAAACHRGLLRRIVGENPARGLRAEMH